jgi:uncharacterized protein (DUF2141 family)
MLSCRHDFFSVARTGWRCLLSILIACATISAFPAQSLRSNTVEISGTVIGGSGKHAIYVALWDENSFLKTPTQKLRIEPGSAPDFHFQIVPGRWALSAFEDENDNGILDMGVFGPKEPSGFWRPFHGWHKPRFADVAARVDADTPHADIKLNR